MLIKQTLLYLPAQLLSPLVQFASILVWAQLLTPADLGVVTLVIATQEVCFVVFFGWLQRYVLRFIRSFNGAEERAAYNRTESFGLVASTLIQTVIILPLMLWQIEMPVSSALLALIAAFMVTRSISNYVAERARADANIRLYSLIQICGPVLGFFLSLPFIIGGGAGPVPVFIAFIVAQILGLLAALRMSDVFHAWGLPDRAILNVMIRYGGVSMIAAMLATFAMNAPRFIVNHMGGLAAMGLFAVGYGLGMRASAFAVTLVTAGSYPLVVRRMEEEGQDAAFRQLSKNILLVTIVVAPVAFGLLGVNSSVVHLLVAEAFRETTLAVLPMATLGGLFRYLRQHTTDQVFMVTLRMDVATWISIIDLVLGIASVFVGMHFYGLPGAALGPLVSGLATLFTSYLLANRMFGFRAPIWAMIRILLAAVGMMAVLLLVPDARNIFELIVEVGLGGAIYVILFLLLMPTERTMVRDLVQAKLARR